MKKSYVKPLATNVAFVVNENIAVSKMPDKNLIGTGTYTNVSGKNCNKVFNSTQIQTGLQPGDNNLLTALDGLTGDDLQAILNALKIDETGKYSFNCF